MVPSRVYSWAESSKSSLALSVSTSWRQLKATDFKMAISEMGEASTTFLDIA